MSKEYVIAEKEQITAIADKVRENDEKLNLNEIIEKVGLGTNIDDLLNFFNAENYAIIKSNEMTSTGSVDFSYMLPYQDKVIKFALLLPNNLILGINPTVTVDMNDVVDIAYMINLNGLQNTTMIDSSGVQYVDTTAYLFDKKANGQTWTLRNYIKMQEKIPHYAIGYYSTGYTLLMFYSQREE